MTKFTIITAADWGRELKAARDTPNAISEQITALKMKNRETDASVAKIYTCAECGSALMLSVQNELWSARCPTCEVETRWYSRPDIAANKLNPKY